MSTQAGQHPPSWGSGQLTSAALLSVVQVSEEVAPVQQAGMGWSVAGQVPLKFTTRQPSAAIVDFRRREWPCPFSTATWRDKDGPTSRARQRAMTSTCSAKFDQRNVTFTRIVLCTTPEHCKPPGISGLGCAHTLFATAAMVTGGLMTDSASTKSSCVECTRVFGLSNFAALISYRIRKPCCSASVGGLADHLLSDK